MMTARCLGAGCAADRDSVNAASASPGRVSLTATSARYPASLAWSNGNTHGQGGGSVRRSASLALAGRASACEEAVLSTARRAVGVLAGERRTLVMGAAGSGKTTLLQWLAVRSARGDLNGPLAAFDGLVPFFIPLRRDVRRRLAKAE